MMADLHPALLDTLGFVPAIRQHVESTLRQVGITASVDIKGKVRALPPEVEATLFRFSQGAMGNIVQHSRAKNAAIVLDYHVDELLLEFSDDGVGFDVSKITTIEESGRGRGVFSMKERIRLLDGSCSIRSEPGQGTTVRARIPIDLFCQEGRNQSGEVAQFDRQKGR